MVKSRSPRGRRRETNQDEAPAEANPDKDLSDRIKAAKKKRIRDRTEEETLLLASLGGKAGRKKWADVQDGEDDV